jgi:rhodanese-related sulfurtransferase
MHNDQSQTYKALRIIAQSKGIRRGYLEGARIMVTIKPEKAAKYFTDKVTYTTGPAELNAMLKRQEAITVVDVRAPEDYQKGHIPGAMNMPKGTWNNVARLDKARTTVVYCYSEVCHLAASAAREFALSGYPVMELEGGWEEWSRMQMPAEGEQVDTKA